MKTFAQLKKKLLSDPKVRAEYEALAPEYELIEKLIDKRLQKKMSQGELAKKAGTRQSAISRLESGHASPSFRFLKKIAIALDSKLTISFV